MGKRSTSIANVKDIAVIGMASVFPGSENYSLFWKNLLDGKNEIQEISPDRWDHHLFYSPSVTTGNKTNSKWAGLVSDIRSFDHEFFGVLPQEARNIDPQIRLLLQEVWHCLEDAAITPNELKKAVTSCFIGSFAFDYLHLLTRAKSIDAYASTGSYLCMAANRISHFLGIHGESVSIDAACASSFAALHQGKLSLREGTSDYALIGAANIICHPWHHITMAKCRVLSPDGQCKTFDKSANGYVRSEGAAVLLLTTKKRALEKGHRIHAIIKGSSVNHCGDSRSISTPNPHLQKSVIKLALKDASLKENEIDYIECHGTGTVLGDAIECSVLANTFSTSKKTPTFIGSVKANIGHLEGAAGLAGLIKVILIIKEKTIPRQINVKNQNPMIDFAKTPLKIPNKNEKWGKRATPRRACVTSLGFGGVNSHVVVEEFTKEKSPVKDTNTLLLAYPIILSARSRNSLVKTLENWKIFCKSSDFEKIDIQDVSYTLLKGREKFPVRIAFFCKHKKEIASHFQKAALIETKKKNHYNVKFYALSSSTYWSLEPFFNSLLSENEQTILASYIGYKKKYDLDKLASLVATYSIGKWVLSMGLSPSLFLGEGIGKIVALLLAKVINFDCGLNILLLSDKMRSIKNKNTPLYPVCDYSSGAIIYPSSFGQLSEEDIENSISNVTEVETNLFQKVKDLLENQFTLKKTIAMCEKKLQNYNIDLSELFKAEKVKYLPFQYAMINLSLLVSLDLLYKKYDIKHSIRSKHSVINNIFELIQKNTIDLEKAFYIFEHPEKTRKIIESSFPIDDTITLEIGTKGPGKFSIPHKFNSLQTLQEYLLRLWQEGFDIDWNQYTSVFFHEGQPVSLPSYSFDTSTFWCEEDSNHERENTNKFKKELLCQLKQ